MSQMFETDIASLLSTEPATLRDLSVARNRIAQLEKDQLRLLDLIEKMIEMDKIRAQAFDLLDERVKRAAVHAGCRQQAIDALNARLSKLEQEVRQS